MELRASLLVLSLAVLSCQRDAPAPADPPAGSSAAAGTGCPGLAEHWRAVWTAETPPGLEHRRAFAVTHALAIWTEACASVAKEPAQDLPPALEKLRAARTFAAVEALSPTEGTPTQRLLATRARDAVIRTQSAYAAAPASGVDECEEAIAHAAFCGDDVDKASVKSAAGDKQDGACAALSVLLMKKCAP